MVIDKLVGEIKGFMATMLYFQTEAKDLFNLYWKGDPNTTISALLGTDPVSEATKLTKDEMISGVTFVTEMIDFFENSAVSTGDYNSTCQNIIYGDVVPTFRSSATESFCDRIKVLCQNAIAKDLQGLLTVDLYFDNEIGDIIGVIDSQRFVPGTSVTAADMSSAITLIQNYRNFIGNQAVTTSDYASTVARWQSY